MSVNRTLLRLLTVKAIANRTLAEDRVRDSDVSDLEQMVSVTPKPVVVVYTDDQPGTYRGRDLFSMETGHTLLVLQLSIAGATRDALTPDQAPLDAASAAAGPGEPKFYFPETSAGLELAIDIMERQVMASLADPGNPWGQLWMSFVLRLGKRQSFRGGSSQQGTRFAARQINIEVEAASDPVPGAPPSPRYQAIIDAIAADPNADFAGLAPLISAALTLRPLSELQRAMAALGLTSQGARAIGLTGLSNLEPDPPVSDIDIGAPINVASPYLTTKGR